MKRIIRVLALVLAASFALLVSPADACGCGAYIPSDASASVSQERVLLRWDGKSEDIVMSLGVLGQSKDAALLLPVPARAELKLGDAKVFDELAEFTKPIVQEQRVPANLGGLGGAVPARDAAVIVLERKQLGPFDVSNLAANDANALGEWLKVNGYYQDFSPRLAQALQPYTDQGWYFVAVRVQPGLKGDTLKGNLDPLWATFATDKLVYPMRASANATSQQAVTLYVLADHRMTKTQAFGSSKMSFAGWFEPAALKTDSALAPFVNRKWFLTKFEDTVVPALVNDDFFFAQAATDEPYRATQIKEVPDLGLALFNLAATLCIFNGILLLLVVGIVYLMYRLFRRWSGKPQAV